MRVRGEKARFFELRKNYVSRNKVAYSRDIVWRVVWQKIGMGLTFRQISLRLQIAVGTAHRIFMRFKNSGEVIHQREQQRKPSLRKLDDLHETYILGLVADNPGLYLSEIAQRIIKVQYWIIAINSKCY